MGAKRVDGLLAQQIDNEIVVFNQAKGEGHALNESAALVFDLCDGKTSRATMSTALAQRFGLPAVPDVVDLALVELTDAGLVTDDEARGSTINRRAVIRNLGLSVMAAAVLPVVETMVARPALAQVSMGPTGPTGSTGPTGPTGETGPTGPG